ncbi:MULTISPECIES: hypothetical protein [Streptomyces]|uniref:Integral membrane protein n=2 Tax=Streptomyces rimosus subsp. rimosus TaxID=132474 RepID=L8EH94_STRR1|nr:MULTISPECIES: hypothetical protein [Streptomyces]KOG79094.1 hypothetical protein ADK78_06675 [Kitasatospora aureofaciens]MYT47163.1 hypothetical protein [Streptomyces sp. SID5471]KEF04381.1 hypothetical protein DF17_24210 [Streptomyces rimosus]KEF17644.1 hypothetical protein DF18_27800 [Streptomyces rimosus]KOT40910.1 hypothetical protein ADK42_12055 [Streptomyces rimosus subsp. rimosus]
MVWEALGSVLVGLVIALAATHWLPGRFPARLLTLATGPAAALLGAFLAHSILGPGHFVHTLLAAAGLSAAMLSLLVRPRGRLVRGVAERGLSGV